MKRTKPIIRVGLVALLLILSASARADVLSLWDMNAVRSDPLDVKILEEKAEPNAPVPHRLLHLTYLSQRWQGQDVRIEAFVAIPTKLKGKLPAVLSLHGHGGAGSAGDAVGKATEFKAVGMSISGPGQGKSTGRRDATAHWIDADKDVRNSFMYQYPYAAMRAITYLLSLEQVDPKRIGVIGGSMGAMCTLIVNGLDSRIAAAVPVSGSGSYEPEMRAGKTWFYSLILEALKIDADHPGVQAFLKNLDPIHYAATQHAPCYVVCGAQDEPFPITSIARTFAKMPKYCRLNLVYDLNHGGFSKPDDEFNMYNNRPQYLRRCFVSATRWLHLHLDDPAGGGKPNPAIPEMPTLALEVGKENEVVFKLAADRARTAIKRVLLCWSLDGSYTYHKAVMRSTGAVKADADRATYELAVVLHEAQRDQLCAFAEVEYPGDFFLTSVPHFGPKFVVKVRKTRFPTEVYRREMTFEQAIKEFEKEIADTSKPLSDRLWRQYDMGKFCRAAGKFDKALEIYADLIQRGQEKTKDSLVPSTLYQRALVYNDQGRRKDAIADLERAIKLYPACNDLDGGEIPRAKEFLAKIRYELRKKK